MIKLSIVLPCYNEGETLHQLVDGYRETFAEVPDVELVLVNNGSFDDTADRLKKEEEKDNPFALKIVTVPVNKGYSYGILTGIKAASGEYLAWSHSDLQCPPDDVLKLYKAVMERPDPKKCFGKGYRVNDRGGATIFTRLQTLMNAIILGYRLEEVNAQPKLFYKDFISTFKKPPMAFELDQYALYKAMLLGMDIVNINVNFLERKAGHSKWAYSVMSRIKFIVTSVIYLFYLRINKDKI